MRERFGITAGPLPPPGVVAAKDCSKHNVRDQVVKTAVAATLARMAAITLLYYREEQVSGWRSSGHSIEGAPAATAFLAKRKTGCAAS